MNTGIALRWAMAMMTSFAAIDAARGQAAGSSTPAATRGGEVAQLAAPEAWAIHAQSTFVVQAHASFHSAYRGANSLDPGTHAAETADITLYAGARLWRGAQMWINPEIDQGFGLSNTLGAAGFLSGEAYKVGAKTPYLRLQRFFIRETIELGGERQTADSDLNQLAAARAAKRVVVTVGKFSVGDIFDGNAYAHDPRSDFLNWAVIDAGTFDYAADAWGYTAGAAAEWYQGRWVVRGGAFLLSNVPNSELLDTRFRQYQLISEIEEAHTLFGKPGKLRVTAFVTRGDQGRFTRALALAEQTGGPPDIAAVRRFDSRPGVSINLEQAMTSNLGAFLRTGWADGRYEAFEFTDIDRTVSGGLALKGKGWGRADDTIGLAGVIDGASRQRKAFLDAGGLGILIGDGALAHSGDEHIVEGYYDFSVAKGGHVALDYQWVQNPGYNHDRGPVSAMSLRLHGQF